MEGSGAERRGAPGVGAPRGRPVARARVGAAAARPPGGQGGGPEWGAVGAGARGWGGGARIGARPDRGGGGGAVPSPRPGTAAPAPGTAAPGAPGSPGQDQSGGGGSPGGAEPWGPAGPVRPPPRASPEEARRAGGAARKALLEPSEAKFCDAQTLLAKKSVHYRTLSPGAAPPRPKGARRRPGGWIGPGREDRGREDRGRRGREDRGREDRGHRGRRGREDRGRRGREDRGRRGREDRGRRGREDRGRRGCEDRGRRGRRGREDQDRPGPAWSAAPLLAPARGPRAPGRAPAWAGAVRVRRAVPGRAPSRRASLGLLTHRRPAGARLALDGEQKCGHPPGLAPELAKSASPGVANEAGQMLFIFRAPLQCFYLGIWCGWADVCPAPSPTPFCVRRLPHGLKKEGTEVENGFSHC